MIGVDQLAAITQRGGVGDLRPDVFRLTLQRDDVHVAQDHGDALGSRSYFFHRGHVVGQERSLEEEVFGRVAGDGQLGKCNEVGLGLPGAFQIVQNLGGVPGDIPYRGVDLSQSQAEGPCHAFPRVGFCRVYRLHK